MVTALDVGYVDLSVLGLIAVSGDDAITFLQGQLTSDVRQLASGRMQYSGMCTPKGRLLASFLLWQSGNTVFIQLPQTLQESIQKRLSMYVLRSKAKLANAVTEWQRFGVVGAGAAALVGQLAGLPVQNMAMHETAGLMVLRLADDRYELMVPLSQRETVATTLAAGATALSIDEWIGLDIAAGVPVILPATQEQFVPQMVNFDLIGAVDFKKGCYTGQEIVARSQYLGKLKRRMYRIHAPESMAAGESLFSPDMGDQASGMIVQARSVASGGWDALAVVQVSCVGHPLHLRSLDGELVTWQELPYAVSTLDG